MENFDLRKFIANEKASFLSEGYDEFQRVDKGKKGVAKKDKGEEEVYGAGVKKGEKLEKEKLKEEDKKLTYSDFVDMVRADMKAGAASDEYASDERVGKEAKWKYNEYLQGTSLDDLFLYEATKDEKEKMKNEIGMFHDPRMSGDFKDADDAWKNGAYHVRFRMLKNKGVGEEKAKELAGTYEDKPWEEVKRLLNLNEVNIFDINPKAKEALEKLMAKGMSEKDARRAITDKLNYLNREAERAEKRVFNPMEEIDDPYDDYEMPGEKWLEEEEKEGKAGYSLGQALFLLRDENEKEVRAWKRKIADDIKANGTGKYLKWSAKDFVDDFKKSLDEINEQMLDSETAIKKFLGYLIKPETMRRVGNTGNFVAKTRTGKVVLIEITPSGGGAIVYELDKDGKKLAKLDRVNWGYPSLDK